MSIIDILAKRHAEDIFVAECKDGPTQSGSHRRLDAWAMKKSWAHPVYYGYEVKTSRSDFLRDDKWHGYLPLCNQLFFVCPSGLIRPEECPDQAGLLWASETRLITKRKAAHRPIEFPENLCRYILMCRARIGQEEAPNYKREYWQRWLEEKRVDAILGYEVGRQLRQRIEEDVVAVRAENDALRQRIEALENLGAILDELGIKRNTHPSYVKGLAHSKLNSQWLRSVETTMVRARAELERGLQVLATQREEEEGEE